MGELIVMRSRDAETQSAVDQPVELNQEFTPAEVISIRRDERHGETVVDYAIWKTAPRERTPSYFPVYSTVSKALQGALRGWVGDWLREHPEILLRPHTAYAILVYQCTHPFAGKATNIFTYDIQQTEALDRAFASAAHRLGRLLKTIDTKTVLLVDARALLRLPQQGSRQIRVAQPARAVQNAERGNGADEQHPEICDCGHPQTRTG